MLACIWVSLSVLLQPWINQQRSYRYSISKISSFIEDFNLKTLDQNKRIFCLSSQNNFARYAWQAYGLKHIPVFDAYLDHDKKCNYSLDFASDQSFQNNKHILIKSYRPGEKTKDVFALMSK
jgi:hypothetical protein